MPSERTPKQIAVSTDGDGDINLFARCDDGTIWHCIPVRLTGWGLVPPIPQGNIDVAQTHKAIEVPGAMAVTVTRAGGQS